MPTDLAGFIARKRREARRSSTENRVMVMGSLVVCLGVMILMSAFPVVAHAIALSGRY
jgi:hypothetical protein